MKHLGIAVSENHRPPGGTDEIDAIIEQELERLSKRLTAMGVTLVSVVGYAQAWQTADGRRGAGPTGAIIQIGSNAFSDVRDKTVMSSLREAREALESWDVENAAHECIKKAKPRP